MNIHLTDLSLFEKLKQATITKVVVGSHLYNLQNQNSDIDYMYIYATSDNELNSLFKTNHQYQFNIDGDDYLFVSVHTFINNIINGDSVINFEVIQSQQLIGTDLQFLYDMRDDFITFDLIKAYLGFAKRDLKYYHKCKTEYDMFKKNRHIYRSLLYAMNMIENKSLSFDNINQSLTNYTITETDILSKKTDEIRKDLISKYENKTLNLAKKFNVDNAIQLNNLFYQFVNSDKFKSIQLKDFDMSYEINAFENWVEY